MASVNRVEIVEVGPRDGLQSDPAMPSTAVKVEMIERLVDTGIARIETASFVNPKRVPQMADADDVMAALPRDDRASYIGLVLNRRGFDRAVAAGVHEINTVVPATDTFAERNQGTTRDQLIDMWADIAAPAREAGMRTSVTVSTAFGCPFEGEVAVDRLTETVAAICEHPPDEVALADTIGVAVPTDVTERVGAVRAALGSRTTLRCHFHDTRNTGVANVAAGVAAGVRVFDASVGGIGGCPFAPAATGNIATEDVVYLLERMGVETGIDLDRLIEVARWLETALGHPVPSMVSKAGGFPVR